MSSKLLSLVARTTAQHFQHSIRVHVHLSLTTTLSSSSTISPDPDALTRPLVRARPPSGRCDHQQERRLPDLRLAPSWTPMARAKWIGSSLIVKAANEEAVWEKLKQDPYVTGKVWDLSTAKVYAYKPASF
ncbi:hypothetical protein DL89DRAFT_257072 [Linderina pennispora]|uniref:YCII-related domain-containing protein n=1 Tax=Linderina pennispora TaxID=61395 RepID=A0A1Y1WBI2_9FUNG|nr:uncharacterized protein DL89DRAFT_257072 [Linderina pennispora]ORX70900.1 hypothetical protein DL89DRAFT_257072 [Linderina pennispora]